MRSLLKIISGAVFIAVFAQLSIVLPLNEAGIPITGQTFAVLLMAIFYGARDGFLTVILYLLCGVAGLPVFAEGASGSEVLFKGSGGFLIGFAFGALQTGLLGERGWGKTFSKSILAMALGSAIIILFGLIRLTSLYGFTSALEYGFYPFLGGALIKISIGGIIPPVYYFFLKRVLKKSD